MLHSASVEIAESGACSYLLSSRCTQVYAALCRGHVLELAGRVLVARDDMMGVLEPLLNWASDDELGFVCVSGMKVTVAR